MEQRTDRDRAGRFAHRGITRIEVLAVIFVVVVAAFLLAPLF